MQKQTHNNKRKRSLIKFALVLAVLLLYAGFTINQYGVTAGLSVTGLTWAFFVFATPIADAGFLLAFPIRLIVGVRMLYTQIAVWIFGAVLVAYYVLTDSPVFAKTGLLELFHTILVTPWPLWLILILSFIGTLVTILFDDDVVDVVGSKQKNKRFLKKRHQIYLTIAIFLLTLLVYVLLLRLTHTSISLF